MRSGVVSLDCTDAEVRHASHRTTGAMTPHPPPRSRPPSARSSRPRPSNLPHRPAPAAPHADSSRLSAASARRPFSAHPPTSAERAQLAPRPVSAREPRHTLMKKVSFMHEKTRSAASAPGGGASDACVVESLDGLEEPSEDSSPIAGPRALRRLKSGWHAPLKPHDLLDEMQLTEDQLPAEVKRAVSSFDARHKRHVTRADALFERLSRELTWERASKRYEQQLSEIRRNRYFVHEVYNPFPASARSNSFVRRKRWKISDSVWKNRPKSNKSDDYFETTSALRQLFMNDWSVAKDSHNLSRFILQSGEADAQEVEHVREVLWKHCRTIYGTFDYFAVLMSNSSDLGGEPDIYNISFTAYLEFCRVGQLGHKRDLPSSELELIWVSVNSEDKKVKERDSFNKQRYLNQQEFLQVIVRVAIARYVRSGKCTKPADAVDLLCHQHLLPLMPKECHHISNNFRSTYCYIPNMDPIIRRHMVTLQSIFRRYSDGDQKHELMSNSALSIGEWLSFLEDLGLAGVEARGAKNVSDTEAKLIFLWSRIRASTSSSITTYVRLRHLYWEDFLEAMVRLAAILALPTDMEIEHSEAADAGEFLLSLRANSETEYMRFVQKTKGSFFQEPRQKIWRCFDHMMMLLVRTIEGNTSRQKYGEADNVVTEKEASQFFQKRRSGLSLMRLQSMGDSLDGSNENLAKDLLQTLELSQQKLLDVLKKISIFDKLDEDQLITLRDAMVEAPFQAGDIVFEQGDPSDSLYVVLEGTFEVLVSQECLRSYPESHKNRMRWKTTKPDSDLFAPLISSARGMATVNK
ncbi:hypothetical protein AB1Y20_002349 [Prymnesium parvum]|uniref:Cyclic nucleotide-binding domain-containing protein n=1 Tax=Prymnesium parvum TaxID=97485 RepID=A0AB34JAT7_PRYPA